MKIIAILSRSCLLTILLMHAHVSAQDLIRAGVTGFRSEFQSNEVPGAKVLRITPSSPAEKAGVRIGDIIVSINDQPITDPIILERQVSVVKAGQKMKLSIKRNGQTVGITLIASAKALEQNKNRTEYGTINVRDYRLRTITTIPRGNTSKMPAVLLIQWLSCGSLELPSKSRNGIDSLLKSFTNADKFVFMRIERRGTGDSEGAPCVDCGLEEELEAYRHALETLEKRPDVAPDKVFILGLSLGGSLAPVVGEGHNIKGYMISGAFTQTWFEHMLDIERRRLKFIGKSPAEVNELIRNFTKFYERYYVEKMTPGEIVKTNPELAGLWYDEPEHQYERPAKFYQCLQDLNIEGAWQNVTTPVLVAYGEYDWIMSLADHTRIADIINTRHPGKCTFHLMKGLSHSLDHYQGPEDAFNGTNKTIDGSPNPVFLNWMDEVIRQP